MSRISSSSSLVEVSRIFRNEPAKTAFQIFRTFEISSDSDISMTKISRLGAIVTNLKKYWELPEVSRAPKTHNSIAYADSTPEVI